jgi:hypothetical protein
MARTKQEFAFLLVEKVLPSHIPAEAYLAHIDDFFGGLTHQGTYRERIFAEAREYRRRSGSDLTATVEKIFNIWRTSEEERSSDKNRSLTPPEFNFLSSGSLKLKGAP